ncbi:uncharacterized protein LOC141718382 [Apium graveolens]|uniref:uncharacterized protein LOC141718382 n=1 Tax=Apium graveolens TaxID=4045 RepID=UPI003D79C948
MNNKAEYEALIAGLSLARAVRDKNIKICGDSRLVVAKYLRVVKGILTQFGEWYAEHVPREGNTTAYALSKFNSPEIENYPSSKVWDEEKVRQKFTTVDANAILATRVPQHDADDRIVWSSCKDGVYTVKAGYKFWHDRNVDGSAVVPRSKGWYKIWQLVLPHKFKIFIWRFCRNNLPVRVRLHEKGTDVPLQCPMCNADTKHLRHVFFECEFASSCWQTVDFIFDTSEMHDVHAWILDKLDRAPQSEAMRICTVLYGIWYWRNQRVWNDKVVPGKTAMDLCFKFVQDWKEARSKGVTEVPNKKQPMQGNSRRWQPPENEEYKVNVDAA